MGAATFFTIVVLLHNTDHLRRGADKLSADVFVAGILSMIVEITVVVLITQQHRLAPLAATTIGFTLASGYLLVHFLPSRAWLSDSLTTGTDVSPLSWMAASLEVIAAIVIGIVGLRVLRARGGLASATRRCSNERSLLGALTHPLAITMIVGNLTLFALSLGQL